MRTRHLTAVLCYQRYIAHVAILDQSGNPVYNSSGEVEESRTSALFDALLKPARGSQ